VRRVAENVYLIKAVITENIIHYPKTRESPELQTQGCNHPADANSSRAARTAYTQHRKQATRYDPEKIPYYPEGGFSSRDRSGSGAAATKTRGKVAELRASI